MLSVILRVPHRDLFIVISILLLVFFTVYRIFFPNLFYESISVKKLFGFRLREDPDSNTKPFSTDYIFFTALHSLNLSFVFFFLVNCFTYQYDGLEWLQFSGFGQGMLYWLLGGLALNGFMYFKYVSVAVVSWVFNTRLLTSRHFMDFVNASAFFFILIALVLVIGGYSTFVLAESLRKAVLFAILIFFFYRSMLLYIRLLPLSPYSKLYIFSYICGTEWIPLIAGLKFVTN